MPGRWESSGDWEEGGLGIGFRGVRRLRTKPKRKVIKIRRPQMGRNRLTLSTTACVPELLQTASDLLRRPALARLVVNPVGNEAIAEGESTKQSGLP